MALAGSGTVATPVMMPMSSNQRRLSPLPQMGVGGIGPTPRRTAKREPSSVADGDEAEDAVHRGSASTAGASLYVE